MIVNNVAVVPAKTPSYYVLNLAADRHITKHLKLIPAAIEPNLTDEKYYSRVISERIHPAGPGASGLRRLGARILSQFFGTAICRLLVRSDHRVSGRLSGIPSNLSDEKYYDRVFANGLEPAPRFNGYAGVSVEF